MKSGCVYLGRICKGHTRFIYSTNSAELLRNVKDNSSIVVNAFLFSFAKILMESLNIFFIFVLLVVVEPVISLMAMTVLGAVSGGFLMLVRRKTAKYGEDEQEQHQNMIKAVSQGLGGLKESIVLGRQHYFLNAFARSSKRYSVAGKFKLVMQEMPQRIIETIAVTGMLLIAVVFLARGGDMMVVIPLLALFGTAAVKLMPSMKALVASLHTITYYRFAVDNVCDELRAIGHHALQASRQDSEELPFKQYISLENISFRYPEAQGEALKRISLQIERGKAVAFVGSSGAGKTTLVDLLLGILKPTSGQICVDGNDVQENLRGWQAQLGYIPQQIYLSDASIANNIAFGVPEEKVSLNQVVEVARIAQLDEFVQSLPDGYDTVIGESGVRLSGGQRQRIGIARALYHQPDVLVMDEATSALDNKTERFFMEALQQLRERYTIIMIAHRLSTVKECDELFMMENGKVTARGTYDELMAGSEAFQGIAAIHQA